MKAPEKYSTNSAFTALCTLYQGHHAPMIIWSFEISNAQSTHTHLMHPYSFPFPPPIRPKSFSSDPLWSSDPVDSASGPKSSVESAFQGNWRTFHRSPSTASFTHKLSPPSHHDIIAWSKILSSKQHTGFVLDFQIQYLNSFATYGHIRGEIFQPPNIIKHQKLLHLVNFITITEKFATPHHMYTRNHCANKYFFSIIINSSYTWQVVLAIRCMWNSSIKKCSAY